MITFILLWQSIPKEWSSIQCQTLCQFTTMMLTYATHKHIALKVINQYKHIHYTKNTVLTHTYMYIYSLLFETILPRVRPSGLQWPGL